MSLTINDEQPDILDLLKKYTSGLDEGPLKEFNQELIGEISSLRMALQIFSDELNNIHSHE